MATTVGDATDDRYDHLIPDDYVQITDYPEAIEVYRHAAFHQVVDLGTGIYRANTLLRTDGAPHRRRRRVMNTLVKSDGHTWFREHILIPTADRMLHDLLSNAADTNGVVRCDLTDFAARSSSLCPVAWSAWLRSPPRRSRLRSWSRSTRSSACSAFAGT